MTKTEDPRVLLVEDDPGDRWIISEILRSRGHHVTACDRAETAWERYLENPFPLALLDWILPGLDGLELCRRIRAHPEGDRTVVVVVTGRDRPEDLSEVLTAGADDYISKPVDVGLLNVRLAVAEKEKQDVQRRRETQRALHAKTRELERANEELEAFAYMVSHDLRVPLRTMQGFAQTLMEERGEALGDEGRDYLRRIIESGRHAEDLIQDLLEYSRISYEDVRLDEVELETVVSTALERTRDLLREAGAQVEVERPLPHVLGHTPTLVQVLANLMSNAAKFVPEERPPRIRLRAEGSGGRIRVWVEDNGIGVPPQDAERIFGVFERLVESSDRPGTGIGLAIVRRAMERIGGRAGVESDGREGSRFWIELPPPLSGCAGVGGPEPNRS